MNRYFLMLDPEDKPLVMFRLNIDDEAETLTEQEWNGEWKESNRIVGYLVDGDPRIIEVDEADAMGVFPEAGILPQKLNDGETTLISKSVEERRFTLGPMYIPNRMDAHAEWTDPEELQNAVWEYVRKGDRRIRLQHNRDVVAGEFVEVMAWPYPVEVPMVQKSGATENMTFPANTVFLGVVWEPWAWELVKENKLRGYSIGGRAERLLADLPEEYVGKAMAPFGDAIRIEAVD
jgi:hypothetical protein